MQKISIFLLCFVGFLTTATAQVDVQINPIGVLFRSVDLSAEFPISEDFGIEGALGYDFQRFNITGTRYKNNGVGFRAIGKYYFSPQAGIDRWNVGAYTRIGTGTASISDDNSSSGDVKNTKFAVGFYTGHKWVSRKNVVFELGLGLGRNFIRTYEDEDGNKVDTSDIPFLNFDLFLRLSIGYRFGTSKK